MSSLPEHLASIEREEEKEFTEGIKKLVSNTFCPKTIKREEVNPYKYRGKTV